MGDAAVGPAWRWARLVTYGVSIVVGLTLVLAVNRYAAYPHIDFNAAYNLQIAQSIGNDFCYCTTYSPKTIFGLSSANGAIQYVGAFFFAVTHNDPDVAVRGTATVGTLLLVLALLALEPWLVVVGAILFFAWPTEFSLSLGFFGEIWGLAFAIFGIAVLRRMKMPAEMPALLRSRGFILACVCFGIAMEGKLLIVAAFGPIVFAIAYAKIVQPSYREWPQFLNVVRAALVATVSAIAGFAVLYLLVAFSVVHSTHNLFDTGAINQAYNGYVGFMFAQGAGQSEPDLIGHISSRIAHFGSPMVLWLFFAAALVLLYANWTYALFIALSLLMWLKLGDNEYHVVMSFYLTIVMGALEAQALLRRFALGRGLSVVKIDAAAAALALIVVLSFLSRVHFAGAAMANDSPPLSADGRRIVDTSSGAYNYTAKLVKAIKAQRYIATSGWWQFPELSLREHLYFYDRTAPSTVLLPKDQVALLIDKTNVSAPVTSIRENCGSIIYAEGPIVLCHIHPGRDSDFQMHTVPNPTLPTLGSNLLKNPSFAQGPKDWSVSPPAMKITYGKRAGGGLAIGLGNVKGAQQLIQNVKMRAHEPLVIKGTITVSGAPLPRMAGADVLFLDPAGNQSAGEGVDLSVGVGTFPFAFQFTPSHDAGQLLLFVHTSDTTNGKTIVTFRNLKVAYLNKTAPAAKP